MDGFDVKVARIRCRLTQLELGRLAPDPLAVFPQSGHAINLEEPDLFNRTVSDFLTAVEAGRWAERQS